MFATSCQELLDFEHLWDAETLLRGRCLTVEVKVSFKVEG